jgi:hypothetical protein
MEKRYLVSTENGIFLISGLNLTSFIDNATRFNKIGDAMKECVRLNDTHIFNTKFKVIPIYV